MIRATVLCDSENPSGVRLTTFVLHYPRFIHAQVMTHRVFARNVSSSRAMPLKKTLESLQQDIAIPVYWGKNQRGMEAKEELNEKDKLDARFLWIDAANAAYSYAEQFDNIGLHKQVANRILEPFLHVDTILSATDFDNFFNLRLGHDAQPEIQELARCMAKAMSESEPKPKKAKEYHLPYADREDLYCMGDIHEAVLVSAARCARVSYTEYSTGKQSTPEEDKRLALRLIEDGHFSPFEHIAMATAGFHRYANFRGWIQERLFVDRDNPQ